ncbi:tRNA (adenosine(37)-N6)-threonylcarbamoyltransferase complex dimerization subunit type 1 TsaB [Alicyclobacillus dauci]|uniref:tRNA (Adenosine(37)-N6)-threonylcarbamoyltransferase complex dimerization subunit type 1 TsaB n=1 Tax=Alicyclobacillus dauci TaxID=1475485 RepID=A0ABY6Z1R1_9BACL|nr:tRNA (adenosine(37)-N6)-threonylcarbamoyltransferase complex dimerization subunit type 1 TsaB [Alicyclobacillus dauci]WAH36669.1 tRNA (adenosine(37)-N6)-threonylcarbamoyltransferase complex dimerization subunit type 1 TsaB [Alicyclobacillus dauci]
MDTATDAMGVGVGSADGVLASGVVQRVLRGHSRLLQPSAQFVMRSAGLRMQDLTMIGVGIGPGSYTGVRMAVATGKAMAHALAVPLTTVPTLDAVAVAAAMGHGQQISSGEDGATDVLVMLFARRHRAYGAWFRFQGGQLVARQDAAVHEIREWIHGNTLEAKSSPLVVHDLPAGEMSPFQELGDDLCRVVHWRDVSALLPAALLRLTASGRYPTFQGDDVHTVEPDYALPVEAEAKLQARRAGGERP